MNHRSSYITPILCLAAFLIISSHLVTGCTNQGHQGSPVYSAPSPKDAPRSVITVMEDSLVLTRIKTRIFSDDMVNGDGIHIMVRHGVVYLTGSTRDHYQGRVAADLIRGVDGVVRVENQLNESHPGTTFETEDSLVSGKIKLDLLRDPEIGTQPVTVQTTNTQVMLTGTVKSQAQKQRASAIAQDHSGDRRVVNQLKVNN